MIEKNSSNPMYKQIYTKIKNEILDNKYGLNGNIGTHTFLAEKYNVSLITIRKAVQMLAEENIVTIQQGKGTFVNNAVLKDNLQHLTGISNIFLEHHIHSEVNVITFELTEVPMEFSDELKNGLGKKCIHIERIHRVGNKIVAYADIYLPERFMGNMKKEDIEKYTIYDIYQNKLGIHLGNGIQTVQAGCASSHVANNLGVTKNSPVMIIKRNAFSREGDLIEYMQLYYEHNSYYIEVKLDLEANNTGKGNI